MLPFATETVTLVKRISATGEDGRKRTEYKKYTLTGCTWKKSASWVQSDTVKQYSESLSCRVPANQAIPEADDYLFLGRISDGISDTVSLRAALDKHKGKAMQITAVSDNSRCGILPHYACVGG